MNFLRDRKLARRLKNNEVSSKEQFTYYLIFQILIAILMTSTFSGAGHHLNIYSYIIDGLSILFMTLIVSLSFVANNKGDKKDFVMRSICLLFPISIQMIIIGIIPGFIAFSLDMTDPKLMLQPMSDEEAQTLFQVGKFTLIVSVILYIYSLWRTYTAMLIASGAKE